MYIDTDKEPENGWLVSSILDHFVYFGQMRLLFFFFCVCVRFRIIPIYFASVESRELRTLADKMLFYEGKSSLRLEQQYNAKKKCYKIF